MRSGRLTSLAALTALLSSACVTTSTTSTTWGEGAQAEWVRVGYVASIRETVQRQQGNPGAGAVAGAVIGGLLGSSIGGHHYDRWGRAHHHGSGAGAVAGAIGGAVVGAAASQSGPEYRTYEIFVRFDDGGAETFVYGPPLAFSVGDEVRQTPRGLERMY